MKEHFDPPMQLTCHRKYIESASFWCKSCHHSGTAFSVEEIQVIEFYQDLRLFYNYSQHQSWIYSKSIWDVTNNVEIITKYMERAFILVQILSLLHNLTGRYELLNWSLFSHFPNLVNFQSSVASKLVGMSPHHRNQPPFYFHPTQIRAF